MVTEPVEVWWVIDKKTGNVLGFAFGPRTNAVWKQLIADLKVVLDKYQVEYDILYTDGHQAYISASSITIKYCYLLNITFKMQKEKNTSTSSVTIYLAN